VFGTFDVVVLVFFYRQKPSSLNKKKYGWNDNKQI
jgi:hypothetical protein